MKTKACRWNHFSKGRIERRNATLFTQLLQNNPGLNFQDIPGCVGSNLASPIDASSAQAVRGTNLPFSSGSAQDSVLQKVFCISNSLLIVSILFCSSLVGVLGNEIQNLFLLVYV